MLNPYTLARCVECGDSFLHWPDSDSAPRCEECATGYCLACAGCGAEISDESDAVSVHIPEATDTATGHVSADTWALFCRCCAALRAGERPCGHCAACAVPVPTFTAAELAAVVPF